MRLLYVLGQNNGLPDRGEHAPDHKQAGSGRIDAPR
jgi:hypothetical protein